MNLDVEETTYLGNSMLFIAKASNGTKDGCESWNNLHSFKVIGSF